MCVPFLSSRTVRSPTAPALESDQGSIGIFSKNWSIWNLNLRDLMKERNLKITRSASIELADQPQIKCSSTGSTTVQRSSVHRSSTAINRSSTAVQQLINRRSTAVQPLFSRISCADQPQINRRSTVDQPQINRRPTADQPQINRRSTTDQP
jgi:hypothetical protein